MIKYYRVIKEHPLWEVGAVITNEAYDDDYAPIEDVWNKIAGTENYTEDIRVVEQSSDFFERVYKNKLDKAAFYTKDEIKKIYNKLTK